jgi:hypothetical protein
MSTSSDQQPPAEAPAPVAFAATPERERFLRRLVPALLIVGSVLLVVFESTLTLLAGVVLLLAAVVAGVVMIAEPGFLTADDEPDHADAHPAPAEAAATSPVNTDA